MNALDTSLAKITRQGCVPCHLKIFCVCWASTNTFKTNPVRKNSQSQQVYHVILRLVNNLETAFFLKLSGNYLFKEYIRYEIFCGLRGHGKIRFLKKKFKPEIAIH